MMSIPVFLVVFVKEMYGGYANVGASLQDFGNFNKELKLFIGDKDVQMMIDKFKRMQEKSEGFYYAYDVDSEGRLTNLFWADSIGRRNFELYGDGILFDAIFDTNKYSTTIYSNFLLSYIRRYNLILLHSLALTNMTDVNEPIYGLLRTTSRSESENSFLGSFTNKEIHYEEILTSCLEMQIKHMSEEVDGVTHFEIRDVRVKDKLFKIPVSMNHVVCSFKKFVMCGIVCKHVFYGLKQIGVTKFPRSIVLNCWIQTADSRTSSNLDVAGVELQRLEHVHNTIKKLNTKLDDYDGSVVSFTKKDHTAAMVGQQPKGEVNILPPNVSISMNLAVCSCKKFVTTV
ncbi:uncharacterized protein LOC141665162 [Apium graveolens]|uniref:uncharacterized protein LOC141665162 n=1 Tax=Apium graveolens TaxID=4045 RepID=UPI003D7AA20F